MEFPATPSNASDSNEYPGSAGTYENATPRDNNKRRSSSRSIKRRRFDDELVEYRLPGASIGKGDKRMRTQSYTSQLPEFAMINNTPTNPTSSGQERRRTSSKISMGGSTGKKARRKGQLSQLSTKDLGRWKPTDDLALILGVQQTNDLRVVHRGIKFSCRFTIGELQSRWYALLYNAEISRVAVAAMRNLHPDLVAAVQQQALYSTAEEELLGTLPSTSHPEPEKFQELLEQNPQVFYPSRTAKSLMGHWQLLKQYQLLPDQTVQPLPKNQGDKIVTFSDAEETMNDAELPDFKEDGVDVEMQLADRIEKKDIRLLENSLSRWQVLVQSVAGGSAELDKNTLAVLRGRLVRYLMRSREIAVGRNTRDHTIDVNLSLEGPAAKVSRKQATIRLRNSGDFFMSSEGKRPIFVDGRPVLQGNKVKLNHDSVIEIAGLRFVFLINQELINAIRQEAVKVNIPV
ncbi:microspherule protein 1 [Achroia grisella]|uniref:microspherule protein 1 n=1 Tax=Achroia grisella TaxID=688607 RepID=UPI0027D25D56|nr:microspherule protein 1 [Achroia grisella]XP_059048162.1 microspherule protein 1 [Achroia grisella]